MSYQNIDLRSVYRKAAKLVIAPVSSLWALSKPDDDVERVENEIAIVMAFLLVVAIPHLLYLLFGLSLAIPFLQILSVDFTTVLVLSLIWMVIWTVALGVSWILNPKLLPGLSSLVWRKQP